MVITKFCVKFIPTTVQWQVPPFEVYTTTLGKNFLNIYIRGPFNIAVSRGWITVAMHFL